jgi:hypothetical protein
MNSAGQGSNRFAVSHLPTQFGAEDFSDHLPNASLRWAGYCWRIREQGERALEMSDKLQFVAGLRPLVHCRKPRLTEVCRAFLNSATVSLLPKVYPATDPVDVSELLLKRFGVGSQLVSFSFHPSIF